VNQPLTEIDGAEMPKRIWLYAYRHAGDICWSSDPNPEDADEIEAVEYVRADQARSLSIDRSGQDIVDALETARQRAIVLFQAYAWGVAEHHGRSEKRYRLDVEMFSTELKNALAFPISAAPRSSETPNTGEGE
jgi:hypothetical protein